MAGIGFELKKLFRRKGILAHVAAVGYTGVITTGPLILGLAYLLLISWIGRASGLLDSDVNALLAMVTYDLMASQLVNSVLSMVTTRYASDMLYDGSDDQVLPSLVGALAIELPVGGVAYGCFLVWSGIGADLVVLNEVLFLVLVAVWMEMGYLTAVKDYKGVLGVYATAIGVSVALAWGLSVTGLAGVESLLGSVCVGYGLMMALDLGLLGLSFPRGGGLSFAWMAWIDHYPMLVLIGVCSCVGLFAHLVIGWANPAVHEHVYGPFYTSPDYDIPALYAVLSMIPTNITFVASTEVEFYPSYRHYFDLLNGVGSISQIDMAQSEMLAVMHRELSRLVRRQLIFSITTIAFGTELLDLLPLGFDAFMDGRFRILCVGYGAYAVANVLSLMLMYYSDYRGAARSTALFAGCVVVSSVVAPLLPEGLLGYGFACSALLFWLAAGVELWRYTRRLPGVVFLSQPLMGAERGDGPFARLGRRLDGVA